MKTYSYSRLGTFDNCKLKYYFTYHNRPEKDFKNTVESLMGSLVHEALEKLYKDLKYEKLNTLDELKEFFEIEWKKAYSEDIKIVRDGFNEEHYIKTGKKHIENYYERNKPFDQDITVGLETEVKLDLFNDGKYVLKGYVDRISTKGTKYIVNDYKTSSMLPTKENAKDNTQLALYAMALKDMYDDVEDVELVWHYLGFKKEIKVTKTNEDYEKIKQDVKEKIDEIEACEEFTPKESALCEWCEFASSCPKRKHKFQTKQMSLTEFNKDAGVELANKFFELYDKEQEIKAEKKKLQKQIFELGNREGLDNIYSGKGTLRLFRANSFKLPPKGSVKFQGLKSLLKEKNLEEYLTVDAYHLIKAIANGLISNDVVKEIMPLVDENKVEKVYPNKKY